MCEEPFHRSGTMRNLCCSTECSLEAKRERYRRKNRARRTKGSPGAYTLAGIAARDDRRCHLCGKRVDMSLSGMDPDGPTIDHLLPLSVGGLDEVANVSLAHRACNIKKGNRGSATQLRLVG
jgi:5-methylcytosine-specific restriction endonuclease McrA